MGHAHADRRLILGSRLFHSEVTDVPSSVCSNGCGAGEGIKDTYGFATTQEQQEPTNATRKTLEDYKTNENKKNKNVKTNHLIRQKHMDTEDVEHSKELLFVPMLADSRSVGDPRRRIRLFQQGSSFSWGIGNSNCLEQQTRAHNNRCHDSSSSSWSYPLPTTPHKFW